MYPDIGNCYYCARFEFEPQLTMFPSPVSALASTGQETRITDLNYHISDKLLPQTTEWGHYITNICRVIGSLL